MDWFIQYAGFAIIYAITGTGILFLILWYFKEINLNYIFFYYSVVFSIDSASPAGSRRDGLPDRQRCAAARALRVPADLRASLSLRRPGIGLGGEPDHRGGGHERRAVRGHRGGPGPHDARRRWMLVFGLGLTLLVETTQLTGAWGLYPCA